MRELTSTFVTSLARRLNIKDYNASRIQLLSTFDQEKRAQLYFVVAMMLSSRLLIRGSILWLKDPFKNLELEDSDDEPLDLPDTFNGIETGLLGHPVMVLHKLDGTTDVAVCLVSNILYLLAFS